MQCKSDLFYTGRCFCKAGDRLCPVLCHRSIRCLKFSAIPHKDCATDASSNFSSDETKSGVNTGCIHEHFCEIWESVSYLTYADCVVRFFERWREKRRKSFVDFRVFSRNISKNMHARCVREDTKQALKGNLQADGVQSRQTLFVRYCLIFSRRIFDKTQQHPPRSAPAPHSKAAFLPHHKSRSQFHQYTCWIPFEYPPPWIYPESPAILLAFEKAACKHLHIQSAGEWYIRRHFRNHQLKACFR